MARYKVILLSALFVFLMCALIYRYFPYASLANAQFNNETQLEQEGFVSKLDQFIYLGDETVVFE